MANVNTTYKTPLCGILMGSKASEGTAAIFGHRFAFYVLWTNIHVFFRRNSMQYNVKINLCRRLNKLYQRTAKLPLKS